MSEDYKQIAASVVFVAVAFVVFAAFAIGRLINLAFGLGLWWGDELIVGAAVVILLMFAASLKG